jgi:hypothetical protein
MNHMTFSYALDRIKMSASVRRHGWDDGLTISLGYNTAINRYLGTIYVGQWEVTQADILANDWSAV